jgi:FixJ family two-component response regulator
MTDSDAIVFVIDDDPSVRKALGRLLRAAGFRAEAFATADEFLRRPPPEAPACVILDVQLPGLSGLDLQRALAERDADLPVVFITGHGDIPMTVRAMKAGAADFLPKPFDDEALLAVVRQAVARHALARQAGAEVADLRRRAATLSPREREVLALVVSGLLNKQVGHRLAVTEKTVKAHRAQVMRKMQASSLAELVRMAARIGLPLPPSHPAPGPAAAAAVEPSGAT